LLSSHISPSSFIPLPHTGIKIQVDNKLVASVHSQPSSIKHELLQPSLLVILLSSHYSPFSFIPLPHIGIKAQVDNKLASSSHSQPSSI